MRKKTFIFSVNIIFSLAIVASIIFGSALLAQARDFKVYPYMTPHKGEVELVYWADYFISSDNTYSYFGETLDKEGLWRHTIEAEYGITDRWTIAGYLDFEHPDGGDFNYVQARAVVTRYRFFEKGERFFDGAIYIEYYLPDHEYKINEHIEAKIILEKDMGQFTILLNPILDKNVSGTGEVDEGMEFEYAAALYYHLPKVRPGLEFYGKLGEIANTKSPDLQEHYIFPAVEAEIGHGLAVDFGLGFGLTDSSDDLVAKFILEYEL